LVLVGIAAVRGVVVHYTVILGDFSDGSALNSMWEACAVPSGGPLTGAYVLDILGGVLDLCTSPKCKVMVVGWQLCFSLHCVGVIWSH